MIPADLADGLNKTAAMFETKFYQLLLCNYCSRNRVIHILKQTVVSILGFLFAGHFLQYFSYDTFNLFCIYCQRDSPLSCSNTFNASDAMTISSATVPPLTPIPPIISAPAFKGYPPPQVTILF